MGRTLQEMWKAKLQRFTLLFCVSLEVWGKIANAKCETFLRVFALYLGKSGYQSKYGIILTLKSMDCVEALGRRLHTYGTICPEIDGFAIRVTP